MTRDEDVVEDFLLPARLLDIVSIPVLLPHVRQRFAIAVSSLVDLHLLRALFFEDLQQLQQSLLLLFRRFDLPQHGVQVASGHGFTQRPFTRCFLVLHLLRQIFDLVHDAGNLCLNLLQRALFALFNALAQSQNRR